MRRSRAGVICGVLSALLWVSLAHAQSVTVRITEAETGHPIFGAFVTLLDHDGQEIRSALTNEQGLFLFVLPQAGRYSVRAQMMGRETRETPEMEVGEGDSLVRNLALSVKAIELEGIAVEGSARCTVRPGQGERTAAVWEEARKALEVASWAPAGGGVPLSGGSVGQGVRTRGAPDSRRGPQGSLRVLPRAISEPTRPGAGGEGFHPDRRRRGDGVRPRRCRPPVRPVPGHPLLPYPPRGSRRPHRS